MFAAKSPHPLTYWCRGVLVTAGLALAGCTSTPTVKKVEDIKADEEHNIVFMGHDVDVGPLRIESLATPSGDQVGFICEDLDTGKERGCFNIPVQFDRTDASYRAYTGHFTAQGALPYKMKFGHYRLSAVTYSVVIGVDIVTRCSTDKKGHTHCYDHYEDRRDYGEATLSDDLSFTVAPGDGCYLGHVQLEMQFNDIIDFSITDKRAADLDSVREGLSEAVDKHVASACFDDKL